MEMMPLWITLIVLISLIISISVVLHSIGSISQSDVAINDGYSAVAEVVDIAQTGVTLNQVPLMRMVVRITDDRPPRVVTIRQYIDFGSMPRASERVRVVIDRTNPNRAMYVGLAVNAH
ncbi:hypothetical protein [Burkholderia ubonensis]|uniref:hypothetical protein n=1 Tax=Burkholderia ubonensis TaxID=101571 RepID=UPI000B0B08FF|nr:hypothetical protein [Burkholderia ubonensis]